ncbi:MAG: hypothetical protein MJK12_17190 [Colwellia sp.]|nr:hypothetical protein [Colwellia sp.]
MKSFINMLFLTFSVSLYANQDTVITTLKNINNEPVGTTEVLTPINNMFDAMRAHDGDKLLAQFIDGAILERASNEDKVEQSDLKKFAAMISKSPKGFDERIFNITVNQSGNLASVWTPFAFYLDGKLSHCGVNSFQLIKQQTQWKIRYLIDNGYAGDCEEFIAKHKSLENKN